MNNLLSKFRNIIEAATAAMLASLFLTFLYQVFARYLLESSPGWTVELCLVLWVWIIFWGSAFAVRHQDHVSFDMIYNAVRPKTQRVLALISAAMIALTLLAAFIPTIEFISFMKIKKSATLPVSMREIFSVYGVFMLAVAVTYIWRFVSLLRGSKFTEKDNHPKVKP